MLCARLDADPGQITKKRMKRCPECRRDYYDDSLLYCLDDGSALLEGPATADEPETAIFDRSVPRCCNEWTGLFDGSDCGIADGFKRSNCDAPK
jgi:hypothetical protein